MIPSGYLLLAKIGAVGALLVGVYLTGRHQGENAVQADWDRSKAQFIDAQSSLIAQHAKEIEALRLKQDQTNIQVSQDHQRAIDELQQKHDTDLAAVRAAGGLRVSRSVCSGSTAIAPEAAGDIGHNADLAGTVALPEQVTNNLFSLASDADRVTEIARSCQAWIVKNGFYNAQ